MPLRLANYVRARRKRWHLSQRELSFLLGLSSQAVVSQHESLVRLPQTKILLKYEALFGEPVGEIFPRVRRKAEEEVASRLKALRNCLEKRKGRAAADKCQLLENLIRRLESRP